MALYWRIALYRESNNEQNHTMYHSFSSLCDINCDNIAIYDVVLPILLMIIPSKFTMKLRRCVVTQISKQYWRSRCQEQLFWANRTTNHHCFAILCDVIVAIYIGNKYYEILLIFISDSFKLKIAGKFSTDITAAYLNLSP